MDLPGRGLLLLGDGAQMGKGAGAKKPEAGLRDQQIIPRLLLRFQKPLHSPVSGPYCGCQRPSGRRLPGMPACGPSSARCRPRILWMLLPPPPTPGSSRKWKHPQACPAPGSSSAELGRPQKACPLLGLRVREGLRAAVVDPHRGRGRRAPRAASACGGGADPGWSPQLLLSSSTEQLQTLAALRLRVATLDQQVHLEQVPRAELLPLLSEQGPLGRPWLALPGCALPALCGGQRFLAVLRDEPADRLSPP